MICCWCRKPITDGFRLCRHHSDLADLISRQEVTRKMRNQADTSLALRDRSLGYQNGFAETAGSGDDHAPLYGQNLSRGSSANRNPKSVNRRRHLRRIVPASGLGKVPCANIINGDTRINGLKQNSIAASQPCKTVNIARQHCRNLWVTAGRLVIRKQDRRHPVTGNLHGRWLQKACQAPQKGARMRLTAEHSFGHTHQTPQKVRSEIVLALRLKRIALVAPR